MIVDWLEIIKDSKKLKLFIGLSVEEFDCLFDKFYVLFKKKKIKKNFLIGRALPKEQTKIRMLIVYTYLKNYPTQEQLSVIFNLSQSQISRTFTEYLPLLKDVLDIKPDKNSPPDNQEIIVDATEQSIQRPSNNELQKKYYSGKKKMHTIKTQIITSLLGAILSISASVPGSVHDIALFKQSKQFDQHTKIFADSGYQGIQNEYIFCEIPYKKPKNGELELDEKEYNTALSKIRVPVENTIAGVKRFYILKNTFRNPMQKYENIFRIACGIFNRQYGHQKWN